jgi:hypothetical protein
MLVVLISRAKEVEQIKRVVPRLIDEGLSVLQYADDTMIFMDNDLERAKNMKLLLCALNNYQDSRSTFIKVNCSTMWRPKPINLSIHKFLGAMQDLSRSDT